MKQHSHPVRKFVRKIVKRTKDNQKQLGKIAAVGAAGLATLGAVGLAIAGGPDVSPMIPDVPQYPEYRDPYFHMTEEEEAKITKKTKTMMKKDNNKTTNTPEVPDFKATGNVGLSVGHGLSSLMMSYEPKGKNLVREMIDAIAAGSDPSDSFQHALSEKIMAEMHMKKCMIARDILEDTDTHSFKDEPIKEDYKPWQQN